MSKQIRNIAIIAHVDHGKTTLVDAFLKQTQTFAEHQSEMDQDLIMDSGDQERERGITITAKITAIEYKDTHINIIDTPGHADFGGEVERTLHMADGCLLIVDAQEGPMPQTKFVLQKAFDAGLKPIVIINKIDKPASQVERVEDQIADLFLELATDDDQLHYPVYYAIGRDGKVWESMPDNISDSADITPALDAVVEYVPEPDVSDDGSLQLLVTSLQWDNYEGKYVIGRVKRGEISKGQSVTLAKGDDTFGTFKVDAIYGYRGLNRVKQNNATAGEIVAVTGIASAEIGQTVTDTDQPEALPTIEIEPPTLSMYLGPNTSPFKGEEGKFTTSRQISERLQKELETNIGLRVDPDGIGFVLQGRGELHLSVLIETMRREGFEFEVGQPNVVYQQKDGDILEPIEEVTVEVPIEHVGTIQSEFGKRRGQQTDQQNLDDGNVRLQFTIPTRTLLGVRSQLVTATKGTLIMHSLMAGYEPKSSDINQQRNGVLTAHETGTTTPYALNSAEARGELIIGPGAKVYRGQIVGLSNQRQDLNVNVCKEKQLNNMRSSSSDGTVQLTPHTQLSLEQSIDFLEDDELLEVTPQSLRLRKSDLNVK